MIQYWISVAVSMATSIATTLALTYVTDGRWHMFWNKSKLETEIMMQKSVQVNADIVTSSKDMFSWTDGSDCYYIKSDASKPIRTGEINLFDLEEKWLLITVENCSESPVIFLELHLQSGRKVNLNDWELRKLKAHDKVRYIAVSTQDTPELLAISCNSFRLEYILSKTKTGYIKCRIGKS